MTKGNWGENLQCSCYCKTTESTECPDGFEKVLDFKTAGLTIYRHLMQRKIQDTEIAEQDLKAQENVFIFHNTKDVDLHTEDILPEIEKNAIKCPRCRFIIDHALKILQKVISISKNIALGVCDHCKLKQQPCCKCLGAIKQFTRSKEKLNAKFQENKWLAQVHGELAGIKDDYKEYHTGRLHYLISDDDIRSKARTVDQLEQSWQKDQYDARETLRDKIETVQLGQFQEETKKDKADREKTLKFDHKNILSEEPEIRKKYSEADILNQDQMKTKTFGTPYSTSAVTLKKFKPQTLKSESDIIRVSAQTKGASPFLKIKGTKDELEEKQMKTDLRQAKTDMKEPKSKIKLLKTDSKYPEADSKKQIGETKQLKSESKHPEQPKPGLKYPGAEPKKSTGETKQLKTEPKYPGAAQPKPGLRQPGAAPKTATGETKLLKSEPKHPETEQTKPGLKHPGAAPKKATGEIKQQKTESKHPGAELIGRKGESKQQKKNSKPEKPEQGQQHEKTLKTPKTETKPQEKLVKIEPKYPKAATKEQRFESKEAKIIPKQQKAEMKVDAIRMKSSSLADLKDAKPHKKAKSEPKGFESEARKPKHADKEPVAESYVPFARTKEPLSAKDKLQPKEPKAKKETKDSKVISKQQKAEIKVDAIRMKSSSLVDLKDGKPQKKAKSEPKGIESEERQPKHADKKPVAESYVPFARTKEPLSAKDKLQPKEPKPKNETKDSKVISKQQKAEIKVDAIRMKSNSLVDLKDEKPQKKAKSEPKGFESEARQTKHADKEPVAESYVPFARTKEPVSTKDKLEKFKVQPKEPRSKKDTKDSNLNKQKGKDIELRDTDKDKKGQEKVLVKDILSIRKNVVEDNTYKEPVQFSVSTDKPKKTEEVIKYGKDIKIRDPFENRVPRRQLEKELHSPQPVKQKKDMTVDKIQTLSPSLQFLNDYETKNLSQIMTKHQIQLHLNEHKNVKETTCLMCVHSFLELDITPEKKIRENKETINGCQISHAVPSPAEEKIEEKVKPLLFKITYDDCFKPSISIPGIKRVAHSCAPKTVKELPEKQKQEKTVPDEEAKGVIRYSLSDRSFIDKGWTMLPTEKVVRKMNVYRMRPAHPEFDWFKHNKNKRFMTYDTGERLAEIDDDGHGRWYYKNQRLALHYYDAEELNAQQRFVIFSNGEPDERDRARPYTVLATFDYLGNGVVFDHGGKIRMKYNQTEGVVLDRSIGPVSHWKWHSLNDPPVLQPVMIDTHMTHKDPNIMKLGPQDKKVRPDNEDMLAIEFDNFIKEKSKKLSQTFKPFQIKMKAMKINENFSLKVLDQANVYLIYREGTTNIKLNLGMLLDHKEIVDTDTSELGEVSSNLERFPARTDSLAAMQKSVAHANFFERNRTERERRLRPPEPSASADKLTAAASRPLRQPLRAASSTTCETTATSSSIPRSRKPSTGNCYYDSRLS